MHVVHHRFVDDVAEADAWVVPKQPALAIARHPGAAAKCHGGCDETWVGECDPQRVRVQRPRALVGVDVENPVAAGVSERVVARGREVALPVKGKQPRTKLRSDRRAVVCGTGVDDDDFVGERTDRGEAASKMRCLVSNDEGGR